MTVFLGTPGLFESTAKGFSKGSSVEGRRLNIKLGESQFAAESPPARPREVPSLCINEGVPDDALADRQGRLLPGEFCA